jgi:probable F420-dependent oxidoreductase
MELGVVFPQQEIGTDPGAIRDFAQAAEALGFGHLLIYDHVLGADRDRDGGFSGPYDKDTPFHEPFVTLGYLAGVTTTITFCTAVLVLPQRQTALVAKQAAQLDVLSGGRLRLGVGVGWNAVEYEALGEGFHDRGRRQDEQLELMRALWTEDSVSFQGTWHTVNKAGINPRPSRPIPIWLGGSAPETADRAARFGSGWIPRMGPNDSARQFLAVLHARLLELGRDPSTFGVQAQAQFQGGTPDLWRAHAGKWQALGATHLAIASMGAGLGSVDEHIAALEQYRDAVG